MSNDQTHLYAVSKREILKGGGGGGGNNFHTFFKRIFSAELIFSWLRHRKGTSGIRRHAPPEIF